MVTEIIIIIHVAIMIRTPIATLEITITNKMFVIITRETDVPKVIAASIHIIENGLIIQK
jgi:hypothetical protein